MLEVRTVTGAQWAIEVNRRDHRVVWGRADCQGATERRAKLPRDKGLSWLRAGSGSLAQLGLGEELQIYLDGSVTPGKNTSAPVPAFCRCLFFPGESED